MFGKKELSATVSVIRFNGHELKYDDGDKEFVHSMLGHNLNMKRAQLIATIRCGKESWQCVVVDLPVDKEEDEQYIQKLVDEADPVQKCFLVEYSRPEYEKLVKERKKNKKNVFDLYLGMYPDFDDVTPA